MMHTIRRIFLFLILNLIICFTASFILSLTGLNKYLQQHQIQPFYLFFVFLVYGMTGAFISLMLSKTIAKWAMKIKIITPYDCSTEGMLLKKIIHNLSQKAQLQKAPEIGIFISPTPNAFATGPTCNNSLVAVSSGLLSKLNEEELEAVIGHEIAHIKNGDMVTMTLLQGVVNTFVIFLSYTISQLIAMNTRRGRQEHNFGVYLISRLVLDVIFMLIGSIILCTFSRHREYKADLGGAALSSKEKMIRALRRLQETSKNIEKEDTPQSVAALMCNGKSSFMELFSTHPPIEKRVSALEKAQLP
jgi:heat shock protein HtpX